MESPSSPVEAGKGLPQVDSFLVEALQNPRHRLTVLRMELDIQAFMRNTQQQQFEFQHFPTSYLRCAAHRVAQHYGLQTMVLDTSSDGSGRITVWKTPNSRFPEMCLSDTPTKQPETDKAEHIKIVLRTRPKSFQNDADCLGIKRSPARTVEERKEDYDRARARIFSGSSSPSSEGAPSEVGADESMPSNEDFAQCRYTSFGELANMNSKEGVSRVAAIFRDREKDRTDPDYDRSYRYVAVRGMMPNQSFGLDQYNLRQPPYMQYESSYHPMVQLPRVQVPLGYRPPNQIMSTYSPSGCHQTPGDVLYMQGPSPAMMYANSYAHLRNASFQVPFHQQPLSFDNSQRF